MPERKGPLILMAVAVVLLLVGLFVMKELVEGSLDEDAAPAPRALPAQI